MLSLSHVCLSFCRRVAVVCSGSRSTSSSFNRRRADSMGKRKVQVDSDDEVALEPSEEIEEVSRGMAL